MGCSKLEDNLQRRQIAGGAGCEKRGGREKKREERKKGREKRKERRKTPCFSGRKGVHCNWKEEIVQLLLPPTELLLLPPPPRKPLPKRILPSAKGERRCQLQNRDDESIVNSAMARPACPCQCAWCCPPNKVLFSFSHSFG